MTSRAERHGRRRFRPTLWASLAVLPLLAILIGLGVWQLERMAWKDALIAQMQERMGGPAVALPAEVSEADVPDLRFQRVAVRGVFLHDRELHRLARVHRERQGFHLITPLRLEDGREILVNRGWVPIELRDPGERPEMLTSEPVRFEAIVREGGWSGAQWLRPANDPEANAWLWIDLDAMAAQAGLENAVTALYLDAADSTAPGPYPVPGQTRVDLPDNHLGYAITWFSIAAVLVVIYFVYHWRPAPTRGQGSTSG